MANYQWQGELISPLHREREEILEMIQHFTFRKKQSKLRYEHGRCTHREYREVCNILTAYTVRLRQIEAATKSK
jgi:hypothetical protein